MVWAYWSLSLTNSVHRVRINGATIRMWQVHQCAAVSRQIAALYGRYEGEVGREDRGCSRCVVFRPMGILTMKLLWSCELKFMKWQDIVIWHTFSSFPVNSILSTVFKGKCIVKNLIKMDDIYIYSWILLFESLTLQIIVISFVPFPPLIF